MNASAKNPAFSNNTFKLWIMAVIFYVVFLYLYAISANPERDTIPDEILLSVVLVLVGYVWIQAIRDRDKLLALNKALLETQEQLEREEINTIAALILTEEAKDPYMRGHSNRVATYALAIAREMGLSGKRQKIVERSAILHDVGKIGIKDDILKKFGELSPQERETMKEHSRKAFEILRPLKFLPEEKEIILHHHESFDGAGYPGGLKGEEIPLEARILAAADSFDAMNSARAYRKPLPKEEIVSEFKKASGKQFDPSVVNVFLDVLDKNPDLWERDK